jgi:hypothetical protein
MMKFLVVFCLLIGSVYAYVPTVDSLFRHGSNPDILSNGISVTLSLNRIDNEGNLIQVDNKKADFFKIFFTKTTEGLKVVQTKYINASFSEQSLVQKIYYPNYNGQTFRPNIESAEKGIFLGVLYSLTHNSGIHLIHYLKSLGVPLKLNSEIINREKIEFLANYKRYLAIVAKNRNARKSELNPLQPNDPAARERAHAIMDESMYTDTRQVKLSKDEEQIVWKVNAGPFEASFSYRERDLLKLKYKTASGEFQIICKDYWRANGAHKLPRYLQVTTMTGQNYQLEVTGLRHFTDREEDFQKRLNNWEQILKGKEASELVPEFML